MPPTGDLVKEWRVPRPGLRVQLASGLFAAGFMGILACRSDTLEKSIAAGVGGVFCLIFFAHIWSEWVNRIQINATRIRVLGLFGTREMMLADVVAMRFVAAGPLVLFGKNRRLIVWKFASLRHSDRVEIAHNLNTIFGQGDNPAAFDEVWKPLSRARNTVRLLLCAMFLLFSLGYTTHSMIEWDSDPLRQLQCILGGIGLTLFSLAMYFQPIPPPAEAAEATA